MPIVNWYFGKFGKFGFAGSKRNSGLVKRVNC